MIFPTNFNGVILAYSETNTVVALQSKNPTVVSLGQTKSHFKYSFSAYQGESIPRSYGIKDVGDLTGWTCRFQVRDLLGNLYIDKASSPLNDDNSLFLVNITPTESLTLPVGEYRMAVQMDNLTVQESIEVVESLVIQQQWVY